MSARRGIIFFTIATSVVSLVTYVWALVAHSSNPLWNRVLITYSLVFWIFLAFDMVGRGLVAHSSAKKSVAPRRPTPQAGDANMVFARGSIVKPEGDVPAHTHTRLARLTEDGVDAFEAFIFAFAREIHAMVDESISEAEAREEYPVRSWIENPFVYPFFVESRDGKVGVIVAQRLENGWDVLAVYIRPEIRRSGFGEAAVQALRDFLHLLGAPDALSTSARADNVRAQRFCEKVGIEPLRRP